MTTSEQLKKKLTVARSQMIFAKANSEAIMLGSIVFNLKLVEDTACSTGYTDGKVIGYNPAWLDQYDVDAIIAFHAHEGYHVGLKHHLRRGSRDPGRWNRATDYVINGLLHKAGFKMPNGILLDRRFDGLGAEQVYDILEQEEQQPPHGDPPFTDDGNGEPSGDDSDDASSGSDGDGDTPDKSPGDDGSNTDESNDGESGRTGSSGNEPGDDSDGDEPGDEPGDGNGNGNDGPEPWEFGEVRDAPVDLNNPIERAKAEQEANVMIQRALSQSAGLSGDVAGMRRMMKELTQAEINPRELLEDFLQPITEEDWTWAKPRRRYTGLAEIGIQMPAPCGETVGDIVCWCDSSGSINDDAWATFTADVAQILTEVNCRIILVSCDDQVRDVKVFTPDDLPLTPEDIDMSGGGCTDMRPAFDFEWVDRYGIVEFEPVAGLYFTDMQSYGWPETEPEFPVIWIATDKAESFPKPKFGDIVYYGPKNYRR